MKTIQFKTPPGPLNIMQALSKAEDLIDSRAIARAHLSMGTVDFAWWYLDQALGLHVSPTLDALSNEPQKVVEETIIYWLQKNNY